MLKFATPLAFAALVLVCVQAKYEEQATADKTAALKLPGDYVIVSGEKFGQKEPEERIKGTRVHFSDDRVIVTDKNKKETYVANYKLDLSKTPAVITMTSTLAPSVGETAKGLVEKDGEQLRLIYALPGGDLPTDFKTKEKQLLFVMKPVSK